MWVFASWHLEWFCLCVSWFVAPCVSTRMLVGWEHKLQFSLLVLNSQCFSSTWHTVNTVVIVEGCFLTAVTADCGTAVISTSIFRTDGLDSYVIIFNKEALLDVYLQLTQIVFHHYHKLGKWQQCGVVEVHDCVEILFLLLMSSVTLLSLHVPIYIAGIIDNSWEGCKYWI